MTESIEAPRSTLRKHGRPQTGFAPGEIATLSCDRCQREQLPWNLRTFGHKQICGQCYNATVELARGAIKAMPVNEPERRCTSCRALSNPNLGSAWCGVTALGDERAVICANFVTVERERARGEVTGGRTVVIDLWRAVADRIREDIREDSYRTWFENIEPVEIEGNRLVLSAPDDRTRDWLSQRLVHVVEHRLALCGRADLVPEFIVEREQPVAGEVLPRTLRETALRKATAGFNPAYTFANFIVGSGNRLAHASALACVEKPGIAYNPLVIHGGVGVGKTHLLQAIGQEALDAGRGAVLYRTSEAFTNELITAIREGATAAFRERYRSVDFLLIDDIQFIAGKEATQEEFFHTFNVLHSAGKQIVVTCDRPPTELRVLEDRLRSRFSWGLMADIQPPDLETRTAIIRSKSGREGRRVPETVINALASRGGRNVREMEGALNRMFALADLLGTEPGMEIARTVLGDPDSQSGACRPSDVLQAVAAYFRVKTSELIGQQRERRISYARQVAMFLLREEAKLSLVEVGHQLGGRNHSTVIYSCDKIAESKSKGRVKQDLQAVKQLIYGVQ